MAGNTAPIHGKVCRIVDGSTAIAFTNGWTLDFSIDLAESSSQGDNWKKYVVGLAGVTGSFTGKLVLGNTEQAALAAYFSGANPHNSGAVISDFTFDLEDGTDYWSGSLFVNTFTINSQIADVVTFTANFTGHDTWTLTST
uniref:Putative structural protein n=1 Tax=viral metagenome TaxID=1070528 RepID=A0A6M3IRW0_9ZZZZ